MADEPEIFFEKKSAALARKKSPLSATKMPEPTIILAVTATVQEQSHVTHSTAKTKHFHTIFYVTTETLP